MLGRRARRRGRSGAPPGNSARSLAVAAERVARPRRRPAPRPSSPCGSPRRRSGTWLQLVTAGSKLSDRLITSAPFLAAHDDPGGDVVGAPDALGVEHPDRHQLGAVGDPGEVVGVGGGLAPGHLLGDRARRRGCRGRSRPAARCRRRRGRCRATNWVHAEVGARRVAGRARVGDARCRRRRRWPRRRPAVPARLEPVPGRRDPDPAGPPRKLHWSAAQPPGWPESPWSRTSTRGAGDPVRGREAHAGVAPQLGDPAAHRRSPGGSSATVVPPPARPTIASPGT